MIALFFANGAAPVTHDHPQQQPALTPGTPAQQRQWHMALEPTGDAPLAQLASHSGLSKQVLKKAMNKGAVWLESGKRTQRWRRADKTIAPGSTIHLYYDSHLLEQIPPTPTLIADQQAYSIWYKPYGLFSQGTKWGDHFAIDRWVNQHLKPQRPAFIVHRLDRAACGLIIIAHRKTAAVALSALFAQRAVQKHYQAIVHGRFPADGPQRICQDIDGRHAVSHASLLHYHYVTDSHYVADNHHVADSVAGSDISELDVLIETGRKHQIRRHLSGLGFAIVGDRLYGQADAYEGDLQLCAYRLAFQCPLDQQMKHFELPEHLKLRAAIAK
jgi:tRNA pseudouridine32 synthase/23S rRNA pseudouridine746 synthase